jgi:E3 ubiquitin-protein ligase FANCL
LSVVCSHDLLQELLQHGGPAAAARLGAAQDASTMLVELSDLGAAARRYDTYKTGCISWSAEVLSSILADLSTVGWRRVHHISPDLSEMAITMTDAAARQHMIKMKLPFNYPAAPPAIQADLPIPITAPITHQVHAQRHHHHTTRNTSPLLAALKQSEAVISSCQEFLDIMEQIDSQTWVQAPSDPSRSCTTRRISLGKHCSLSITLDPASPTAAPPADVQFLGEASAIAPMHQAWYSNLGLWDPCSSFLGNIQQMLGFQIPGPQDDDAGDDQGLSSDCAICYAYLLPDPAQPEQEGKCIPLLQD